MTYEPDEHVVRLLNACPFLVGYLDADAIDLPTVIFGQAARAASEALSLAEQRLVFQYFNYLAENGSDEELTILATGAVEIFNDSAHLQRMAREQLTGAALKMLEECRVGWGQPDYGY